MGRHHAERHEVAALRDPRRLAQRTGERLLVSDEMIGRQHQRHLVRLAAGEHRGQPGRDGGRARQRLAEDVVLGKAGQLLARRSHVRLGGDDVDVIGLQQRSQPAGGLLQQARLAGQVEQLLRRPPPRQRPEAGAGSAGHDDGEHVSARPFRARDAHRAPGYDGRRPTPRRTAPSAAFPSRARRSRRRWCRPVR